MTLRATVAEVESAPTSATSRAAISPCFHHLQHCVQLRDAMLPAMMHRVSAPLRYCIHYPEANTRNNNLVNYCTC